MGNAEELKKVMRDGLEKNKDKIGVITAQLVVELYSLGWEDGMAYALQIIKEDNNETH